MSLVDPSKFCTHPGCNYMEAAHDGGALNHPFTPPAPPRLSIVTPDTAPPQPIERNVYSLTDDGNGLHFVDQHAQEVRYVPERGQWLIWDDDRWVWDSAGRVREMAKVLARQLPFGGDRDQDKHRNYSLSARGLSAALSMACTDARIVVSAARLDAQPLKLNTPAGEVDLLTGRVDPPHPEQLHTRRATVSPDFALPTPRWDAFLVDTFGDDKETIGFVQRLAGYSASGDTRYHVLPFLHGGGQNGKSVMMDVLRALLGDYATTAPAGFLLASRQEHSTEIARLHGMRLVVASEVNQGTRFDEAKVKELTGGDTITARFMNKDFFTFAPTHHLWLMGNHQPEVKTGGDSFWRRLRMVPFLHKVPDHKKIGNLSDLLIQEEGPGILAWVIRGAQDVFSGGLREPESVMAATNEYAAEEDHLSRFLEETVRMGGGEHVLLETGQLRQAYETWCKDEGIKDAFSAQTFGRELKLKNIKSKKSNGKRFYIGLALLDTIPDHRSRQGQ